MLGIDAERVFCVGVKNDNVGVGTTACVNGMIVCNSMPAPNDDTCDGNDDDQDGDVEPLARDGRSAPRRRDRLDPRDGGAAGIPVEVN